jgi:hypothetical protein
MGKLLSTSLRERAIPGCKSVLSPSESRPRTCRLCGLCHSENMSKKKKKKSAQQRKTTLPPHPTAGENRASVAVTVAWMLSLLVSIAADAIAVPATIMAKINPHPIEKGLSTAQVANLFLFVALVTGFIAAGLVPVVCRVRVIPPPQAIVIAALVAGAVPPITIVLRWLL